MRLKDYLEARGESVRAFAVRSGVNYEVVRRIVADDAGCHVNTAVQIVEASKEELAPGRKSVGYKDLITEGAA